MKKMLALLLALVMVLSLAACASSQPAAASTETAETTETTEPAAEESAEAPAESGKTYTVGVCQLVQHEALDAATQGFIDALKEELGDAVTVDVQNASGDSVNCGTIVNGFVSKGVDLIMANATPALTAAWIEKPPSNPKSIPPQPENKDNTRIVLGAIYIYILHLQK